MKGFLRKVWRRWAPQTAGKTLRDGTPLLFLNAREDLTEKEQKERNEIAETRPHREQAWQRNEAFRSWDAPGTEETAEAAGHQWMAQVQHDGLDPLRKTVSVFMNGKPDMLACFRFRISHGCGEGKNPRTKAMIRQGEGGANREHVRLRIFWGEICSVLPPFHPQEWRSRPGAHRGGAHNDDQQPCRAAEAREWMAILFAA